MKIQKLNDKQQKRLLKLCNEFFPELYSVSIGNYYKEYMVSLNQYSGFDDICEGFLENRIHWYQLCLTKLPKRIFNKTENLYTKITANYYYGSRDYTGITQAMCFSKKHPVDFLWEFVKECKKKNLFKTKKK